MDAPTNGNPFDNVEPHLHLPAQARAALWSACELVLARPDDFADAVAWLDSGYSEAAMRERVLRDSRTIDRLQLRAEQRGVDPCDTF
jgi:hypothetical protein